MTAVFGQHSRQWRDFRYVYPVISRRSHGLSIGINLSPGAACNFNCVYCQVNRTAAAPTHVPAVDLDVVDDELRTLLANPDALFDEPEFAHIPAEYRRLNDVAFSGDGEPTGSPCFPEAARRVVQALADTGRTQAKVVVITNAGFLHRPAVAETLAFLAEHNGEVWAKLDAGTQTYYELVNRCAQPLRQIVDNIRVAAQRQPLVIQSMFLRMNGTPPPPAEIEAYLARLRELQTAGAQLQGVQVYTVARTPAESFVAPLSVEELEAIATRVRSQGISADVFG